MPAAFNRRDRAPPLQQMQIDFAPGLLEQFPNFMDAIRADVHACGRQFKAVAADCDMSSSELNRRLADVEDPPDIPLRARDLPKILAATGGTRSIQWLVLTFMGDPTTANERTLRAIAAHLPMLVQMAQNAGLLNTPKPRR